ncbi:unnamed protein product, partial [Allacma fusca]
YYIISNFQSVPPTMITIFQATLEQAVLACL